MKMIPGSPLGNTMKLTKTQQLAVEKQYGLNRPVWQQYLSYMGGLLQAKYFDSQHEYEPDNVEAFRLGRIQLENQLAEKSLSGM